MASSTERLVPPFGQSRCPVTGLRVVSRPEWIDVHLVDGYSASFCIIGDGVLLTAPRGNSGNAGVPRFFEVREAILRDVGLWERPHVEIKDYHDVDRSHPRVGRVQFTELLLAEGRRGWIRGFWGFDGPLMYRFILNVAKRLVRHAGAPVEFVKDYRTAILKAVQVREGSGMTYSEAGRRSLVSDPTAFSLRAVERRDHAARAAAEEPPRSFSAKELTGHIDDLLDFIGAINWNAQGVELRRVPASNPLGILYEATAVLKQDFDSILREKEEMQEQYVRAAKLAAVATLSAGFAHELNNPLTAVLGFARRIREHTAEPATREAAEVMIRAASRMERIVAQLCQSARGLSSFGEGQVDLSRAVLAALSRFELRRIGLGVTVQCSLPEGLPPVRGSAAWVEELLQHVLQNAFDAFEERDPRSERCIWIEATPVDDGVRVAVKDTAGGMPDDVRQQAFDPFFTTKEVGRGAGLGLFVAHQLATELDGELVLNTTSESGVAVELTLPAAAASQSAVPSGA